MNPRDNVFTGEEINDVGRYGIKSRSLFNLGGNGDLTLTLDYAATDSVCCAPDVIDYIGNGSSLGLPFETYEAATGIPFSRNPDPFDHDISVDSEFSNEVKVGGMAAEWVKELDNELTLTWINAWRGYKSASTFDGDFSHYDAIVTANEVDLDQFSSEFRITSPADETWDYQVGLYYFDSSMDTENSNGFTALTGGLFAFGLLFPEGSINFDTNQHETTSYAVFGQTNWHVADKWKFTFGARINYEEKAREGSQLARPTPPVVFDTPPIAGPDAFADEQRSDVDFSPSLSISYMLRDGLMLYASASQGFKSGGFNQLRTATGVPGEFDEERSRNYELGWKGTWLQRRLQLNGTVFFVEYDDFQAQGFDGANITVRNAGSLESRGLELELAYVPNAITTLGVAVGYNDATYSDFETGECTNAQLFAITGGSPFVLPDCVQDLTGKELDNAPKWTVSNFIQLVDNFPNSELSWFARLEYNYTDEFYMAQDLDESLLQGERPIWSTLEWGYRGRTASGS